MRTLRLARIAAEAEGLRLRHSIRRNVVRLTLALVAGGFLAGALVLCHVAGWFWLRQTWERPAAALIIAGADFVLAVFFALLAARSSPGRIEIEALAVRQRALDSATGSMAVSALVMQLLRVAVDLVRRKR
jgi:hypothetical protein